MIKGERSRLELLDDYANYNKEELDEILAKYQNPSFSFVELANKYLAGENTMDELLDMINNKITEEIKLIIRGNDL